MIVFLSLRSEDVRANTFGRIRDIEIEVLLNDSLPVIISDDEKL